MIAPRDAGDLADMVSTQYTPQHHGLITGSTWLHLRCDVGLEILSLCYHCDGA